jgi:hypothetical protein
MADAIDYGVNVTRIDVTPNQCGIDRELNLEIDFECARAVQNGQWSVTYVVDSSYKRHLLHLGTSGPVSYASGAGTKHTFKFAVDKIDVAAVKRSLLLNVGLLQIALKEGDNDVIEINLVTQVNL